VIPDWVLVAGTIAMYLVTGWLVYQQMAYPPMLMGLEIPGFVDESEEGGEGR
jgi:hypothetical protein